jgi:hypothetical protein
VSSGWVEQQGVNSWQLTRDESGWIFAPRSQEKGSPSKRGSKICKGKRRKSNVGAKRGIDQGAGTVNVFIRAYSFVYVICE